MYTVSVYTEIQKKEPEEDEMQQDEIVQTTKIVRNGRGHRVMAELNPRTGDPQVFPYTEADSNVIRLAAEEPDNAHVQEVAQSIRDHREAYRAGHTTACRGDLRRGLCH